MLSNSRARSISGRFRVNDRVLLTPMTGSVTQLRCAERYSASGLIIRIEEPQPESSICVHLRVVDTDGASERRRRIDAATTACASRLTKAPISIQ